MESFDKSFFCSAFVVVVVEVEEDAEEEVEGSACEVAVLEPDCQGHKGDEDAFHEKCIVLTQTHLLMLYNASAPGHLKCARIKQ